MNRERLGEEARSLQVHVLALVVDKREAHDGRTDFLDRSDHVDHRA